MCGIVGALSFSSSGFRVEAPYIERMRETMVHRGPDGAGTWVSDDGRLGLGHRRLSIIDLSDAAAQPMSTADGQLVVSFNGEIYNHAEIRRELIELGHGQWRTDHSDTEVLLRAFQQWGIECLSRFKGMFAIALWDASRRELWLIRDRMGIKPLYYSVHHGRITFASEIKAILQDPDQQREVNEEAFFHFLSFKTTPAPSTLFDGIRKLPAGSWLRIDERGDISESRYYDVLDHTSPLVGVSNEEICERVRSSLRNAVELRKVGDVPVGVFLSGGIDSSTNAALFSEGHAERVRTYSIGYRGDYASYRNELDYARLAAREVNAEHHELLLTQDDLIDFLPRMIHLQDEPLADQVCVPVYYVSKLARDDGTIVCQVGEGADELFCGYPSWKTSLGLQRLSSLPVPRFLRKLGLAGMRLAGRGDLLQYEWMRRSSEKLPIFWGGSEAFSERQKQRILSPRLRRQFDGMTSWEALAPIRNRFEEKAWETSDLNWMTYLDLSLRLPELLLMRVDKMAMGVSLEARVPFLDHEFVELALSIPTEKKVEAGVLKTVLKQSVRGIIPDELIDRPKQGFGVPLHEWFVDRLGDQVHRELSDFCDRTDFLDRDQVMQITDDARNPDAWLLYNFALWWKEFLQ